MVEPPLAVVDLHRSFGALKAVAGVSLALAPGELHALIGPNGAGKTTLVDLISGEQAPDAGRVRLRGRDVTRLPVQARARLGLGRTFQLTSVLPGCTVLENVVLAAQAARPGLKGWLVDPMRSPTLTAAATVTLGQVGLAGAAEIPAETLAHGQKRRLELAMALIGQPAVLLLDEPMAGLGPEEGLAMTALLRSLKGRSTILLIEHDMDLVFALADRVSVLVAGELVASGPAPEVRRDPKVRRAYLGEDAGGC
jgi:branched-chain amino acid transport system ATP-binding protein